MADPGPSSGDMSEMEQVNLPDRRDLPVAGPSVFNRSSFAVSPRDIISSRKQR